jgi:hypothetical protein
MRFTVALGFIQSRVSLEKAALTHDLRATRRFQSLTSADCSLVFFESVAFLAFLYVAFE